MVKLFTEHPELRAAFTELKASCVAMETSQIETAMRAYLGHVDRVVAGDADLLVVPHVDPLVLRLGLVLHSAQHLIRRRLA